MSIIIIYIYFSLDSGVLPVDPSFDPALGNTLAMQYTWSRVPHGIDTVNGKDGRFGAKENLAQNYLEKQGLLLEMVVIWFQT